MTIAQTKFLFKCSSDVKNRVLSEGLDLRYGARHLKRAVERLLVNPLSNLVATGQIGFGDLLYIDLDESNELTFSRTSASILSSGFEDTPAFADTWGTCQIM